LILRFGKVRFCSGFGEMWCGTAHPTLCYPDERLRRLRIKPFFAFKVVPVTFRSEKQLLMQLFSAYRPSIFLPNAVRVDEKVLRRRTSRSCTASYAPFQPVHRAPFFPSTVRRGSGST